MTKTFAELCATKVVDLRKQCEKEGKGKTGNKMELVKRLFPEAETYVFLDKKLHELKQISKSRGMNGYSKQKWSELIVRLQTKATKPNLPMELVMFIRKQATDMSFEELRRKKQKQTFRKMMVYIERTNCRVFYEIINGLSPRLLNSKQKTIIHQVIENDVLNNNIDSDNTFNLVVSKLRDFGFVTI